MNNYFFTGNKFYEKGNYSLALVCYKRDLKTTKDRYTTLYNTGLTYLALNKYHKAFVTFKTILEENLYASDKEWSDCLYKLGFLCMKTQQLGKSRQYLTQFLCINEDHEQCKKHLSYIESVIFSKMSVG